MKSKAILSKVITYPVRKKNSDGSFSWKWSSHPPGNFRPIDTTGTLQIGDFTWYLGKGRLPEEPLPDFAELFPEHFPNQSKVHQDKRNRFDHWIVNEHRVSVERPNMETRAILELLFERRDEAEGLTWSEIQLSIDSNHRGLREVFGRTNGAYSKALKTLVFTVGEKKGMRYSINPEAKPL